MPEFTSPDGLRIAYQTWGDRQAGVPVVLHHGFVVDARINWEMPGIVAALTETGRPVVAIDARGHGASEKPTDPALYGESRMSDDLMALCDELEIAEYDLVGYSMGAIVSAITATRDPRVRRLVIGGVGSALVELGGVDTRAVPNAAIVAALEAEDGAPVDPAAAGFLAAAQAIKADRAALAAQARSVHAEPIPLHLIDAPTLLLAGDADPLAERPQVVIDAIRGAELCIVPGDHMAVVGHPEFSRRLVAFVA